MALDPTSFTEVFTLASEALSTTAAAAVDAASAAAEEAREANTVLQNLGREGLAFLAATVVVIPLFRSVNISPVLGYLISGVLLKLTGVFASDSEIAELSELGILFLLFEMGLELSFDRLKGEGAGREERPGGREDGLATPCHANSPAECAFQQLDPWTHWWTEPPPPPFLPTNAPAMSKFAFGLGIPQVLLCTAAFTLFTPHLGFIMDNVVGPGSPLAPYFRSNELLSIQTYDQSLVVGAALAQSSSAFVLQIVAERGVLATRFGSATLGVLLLQDMAVVPLLVLLPLIEDVGGSNADMSSVLQRVQEGGGTALLALAGLGGIMFGGRLVLRRVFELVAESRSADVFVALSLLTVTGTAVMTQALGFSDTLGAFVAGVLLAETTFRTQVRAGHR